jgi:hypothetical protein
MPEVKSPGPVFGKADIQQLNRFGPKPKFEKTVLGRNYYDRKYL